MCRLSFDPVDEGEPQSGQELLLVQVTVHDRRARRWRWSPGARGPAPGRSGTGRRRGCSPHHRDEPPRQARGAGDAHRERPAPSLDRPYQLLLEEGDRVNCPVDGALLQMSERQGIEIDYCPTCRGVWLDRGELDKIIERSESAPAASAPRSDDRSSDRYDDRSKAPQKKKRTSFLSELFEG